MSTAEVAKVGDGLYAKLAAIAGELSWIEKGGFNEAQKYAYVRAEDIADAVREKLAARGIAFIPSAESITVAPTVSGKQHVTTVKMRYRLVDSESGQEHTSSWYGTGADSGDKGLLKAYTAAQKYFFIDLFQIPTGKDPDADGQKQERAKPGARALREDEVVRIEKAVEQSGVDPDEWELKLGALGVASRAELTSGHAKQIKEWLDARKG